MAVYLGDKVIYSGKGSGGLTADLPADTSTPYESVEGNPARPLYSEWGTLQSEVNSCLGGYNNENFFVNILQFLGFWQQDFNFTSAYGFIVDKDYDSLTITIGDYYATSTGVGGAKRTTNTDGTVTIKSEVTLTDVKRGTRIVNAFMDETQFDITKLKFPDCCRYAYFNCDLIFNSNMFTTNVFRSYNLRGFEIAKNRNIIFDSSTDYSSTTWSIFCDYPHLESLPQKLDLTGFNGTLWFADDCHSLKQLPDELNISTVSKIRGFLYNSSCPEEFPYEINLSGLTTFEHFLHKTSGIKRIPKPITISANCDIANFLNDTCGIDYIEKIDLTVVNSGSSNYSLSYSLCGLQAYEIKEINLLSTGETTSTNAFGGISSGPVCVSKIGTITIEAPRVGTTICNIEKCSMIDKVVIKTDNSSGNSSDILLPAVHRGNIGNVEIYGNNKVTLGVSSNSGVTYINNIDNLTISTNGDIVCSTMDTHINTIKNLTLTTTNGNCEFDCPVNVDKITVSATGNVDIDNSYGLVIGELNITTQGDVSGGEKIRSCGNVNITCGSCTDLFKRTNIISLGDLTIESTGDVNNVLSYTELLVTVGNVTISSGTKISDILSYSGVAEVDEIVLTAPIISNSLNYFMRLQDLKVTLNADTQMYCSFLGNANRTFIENLDFTATALNLDNSYSVDIGGNISAKNLKVNINLAVASSVTSTSSVNIFNGEMSSTQVISGQVNCNVKGDVHLFQGCQRLENFDCILDINTGGNWLYLFEGTTYGSALTSLETLDLSNSSIVASGFTMKYPYSIKTFIGDFSNLTSTSGPLNIDNMYNLVTAKIIIPSTDGISSAFSRSTKLSTESLNYIANNAPTVSSKYIYFRDCVIDKNADWYKTLTDKGWSIGSNAY